MDDEVQNLKSMAAKLRAEAAAFESDKAQEIADATERAFRKFDINDGVFKFRVARDSSPKTNGGRVRYER